MSLMEVFRELLWVDWLSVGRCRTDCSLGPSSGDLDSSGRWWQQGLAIDREGDGSGGEPQKAQEKTLCCSPCALTAWVSSGGSHHGSPVAAPSPQLCQIHVTLSLLAGKTLWKKQKLHWILFWLFVSNLTTNGKNFSGERLLVIFLLFYHPPSSQ